MDYMKIRLLLLSFYQLVILWIVCRFAASWIAYSWEEKCTMQMKWKVLNLQQYHQLSGVDQKFQMHEIIPIFSMCGRDSDKECTS